MCSICGIFDLQGKERPDEAVLKNMMWALRHRGPDGSNHIILDGVGLGFNRLSFLDLEGGMQPLQNENGTVTMICNGEIYNYRELRDQSWETSLYLESKNKDLMEKQDYEIRLATLNERNRIAREIHDNVGHMLSRSILQVGALMAVCRDDSLNPELSALKSTLTDAMDSIRKSVHDLHDDSINLHDTLTAILSAYKFCPVRLDDGIESIPPAPVRYCFSAIVREALSNTARHSDATQVTVTLREHPALYQLLIRDNGTKNPPASSNGIGLSNMAERVASLGGHFRTDFKNGFHIFISIPKGEQQNERTSDRR